MTQANPAQMTPAGIYAEYDRIIETVESWIARRRPHLAGCDAEHVRARIVQRLVELTSDGYAEQRVRSADGTSESSRAQLSSQGITICIRSGRVWISLRQRLRHFVLFGATWSRLFVVLLVGLFRAAPVRAMPATLLLESPSGCTENDAEFIRFCTQGAISPLARAGRLIIASQHPPRSPQPSNIVYAPQPLHYLAAALTSRPMRVTLLLNHLLGLARYLRALAGDGLTLLLSRDAAYVPVVRVLDRLGLIDALLVTTSSFLSQALWMKGMSGQRFRLHMIWYSQNFIPKMYQGDVKRPDLPPARHMRVDVHWVWTEGFRNYLRQLRQTAEIHVVGPILWYLPAAGSAAEGSGREHSQGREAALKVALFDITPLPDGTTAFGAIKNYYSVATITRFVLDSVACCDEIAAATGRPVLLFLKHKRAPKIGRHASGYLEFLEELVRTRSTFSLIDHQTNLFGLLENCDLSISVPYTSTAYVAAHLRKPAVYYDPFGELLPDFERNDSVRFAAGQRQLLGVMKQCLGLRPHARSVARPAGGDG